MLNQITPVIITYNEAPNIARTLEKLKWAEDIVVLDSFSEDETLSIIAQFPQVRILQRAFDNHANQCNYALREAGIHSEWVLFLDADYVLEDTLIDELMNLNPDPAIVGFYARFIYCIFGRPLRASLYPQRTVLFRKKSGSYQQDGHAHRLQLEGKVVPLKGRIMHDDRKSFSQWLVAQDRYQKLEAEKLYHTKWSDLKRIDCLRKIPLIAPFAVLFYCLFIKGLILDGAPGLYYAYERLLAEIILSLHLISYQFKSKEAIVTK